MKICMIAPQPFFEPRGTPFSVLGRLKALSHLGHEVDLLTYHLGQDVALPGVTILRIPPVPFIRRVPVGPSGVKVFLDLLLLAKAFRLLSQKRYDLLHTHEEASFFGMFLARHFKLRHLYDMHSSLPQQLQNFQYTRFQPIIRLFEGLEARVLNSSDALITICPALAEQVHQRNAQAPQMMIENVASEDDPQTVSAHDVEAFRVAHGLAPDRAIVLYTGTFEPYQGLDLLLAAADVVLQQRQAVLFLLIGGKPEQVQRYHSQVQARGLAASFHFTGTRPAGEIPCAIRLADVLVSPRVSGTNTPLKIYTYLQSGKPIVATHLPTHTQVLHPEVAVLVDPTPAALAQGILTVLNDRALAHTLGQQARQLFERRYSFQMFVEKTEQVLQLALR